MGNDTKKISKMVIRRLPRYFRYLSDLRDAGVVRISSTELSEKMHVTASQIRQDLNCFGGFGQQGYGYNVQQLYEAIGDILGLNRHYKMIIIGAGNLGHALAHYAGFRKRGFRLVAMFDNDPEIVGREIYGMQVRDIETLETYCEAEKPEIAVLTVSKPAATSVAKRLEGTSIRGIWNFSFMELTPPQGIYVENVHLSDSLMTLSHHITNKMKQKEISEEIT